jgi:hypothetical protein
MLAQEENTAFIPVAEGLVKQNGNQEVGGAYTVIAGFVKNKKEIDQQDINSQQQEGENYFKPFRTPGFIPCDEIHIKIAEDIRKQDAKPGWHYAYVAS